MEQTERAYLDRIFKDITPGQIENAPTWQDYKKAGVSVLYTWVKEE